MIIKYEIGGFGPRNGMSITKCHHIDNIYVGERECRLHCSRTVHSNIENKWIECSDVNENKRV